LRHAPGQRPAVISRPAVVGPEQRAAVTAYQAVRDVALLVLEPDAAAGTHEPLRYLARGVASGGEPPAIDRVECVVHPARGERVARNPPVARVFALEQPVQVRTGQEIRPEVAARHEVHAGVVRVEPRGAGEDGPR